MLMDGHLKIIEGLISRANELEKEWKEALHSVENKDEDYEFDLYESYLNREECLFSRCHKMYYVRNFLTEEIDRTHRLCEEESRNEGSNAKPGARENKIRSLTELIEKLVTTSKLPTLSPIEFDGNPRMWGQFISQFEQAIHKRMDLTPTQKFMHLLSSLKGEANEEISDLMVNEENYPLAMKNLYERYGDRNQRIYELYKSLENVHCLRKDPFRKIRELLNILSQLKGLGENIETMQLNVMVIERIPQDMAKRQRCKAENRMEENTQSGRMASDVQQFSQQQKKE
ncbi:unnamed protein product, partial [Onchocerca ochengi]|uniref:Uncharacterized protein n=1 Tax=Onchocerca ochengi TaxID=42157 RepID=A0A182EVB0_ONCOC